MKIGLLSVFFAILLLLVGCANREQNEAGTVDAEQTETQETTPGSSPTKISVIATDEHLETFTLSDKQPETRLPVALETLEDRPEILEITITEIRNGELTPFSIFVYLEWEGNSGELASLVLIEAITVFPPDQPGRYTLRVTNALSYVHSALDNLPSPEVNLLLQLRPISDAVPLSTLDIEFTMPEWIR